MRWNYEDIKFIAEENNLKVKDLLALAPKNDPFYVGTKGQMEKARWFAEIYKKMGSTIKFHIRRVHYYVASLDNYPKPDRSTYENTNKDWNFMTMSSKYARYANLVPFENVIDKRNPQPTINLESWSDRNPSKMKDYIDVDSISLDILSRFNCWNPQNSTPYHIELWCEKSTMNDILDPIGRRYGVNVVNGLGELSISAVYQLIERIRKAGKSTIIFYISDFDPAGENMPISVSRKIEYFARRHGIADVKLKQIMLTAKQCIDYSLPRKPIKKSERRKEGFEQRHGTGATELDALEALHPGAMRQIIQRHLDEYIDIDYFDEIKQQNHTVRNEVSEYLEDNLQDVMEHLDLSKYDDYEPPKMDKVNNNANWLYDSALNYIEQLKKYKKWRHKISRGDT